MKERKRRPRIARVVEEDDSLEIVGSDTKVPKKRFVPLADRELKSLSQKDLERTARRGGYIVAVVKDTQNKQLLMEYMFEGEKLETRINFAGSEGVEIGRRVRLTVSNAGNAKKNVAPQFRFDRYDK